MSRGVNPKFKKPKIQQLLFILGFILIIAGQYLLVNRPINFDRLPPPTFLFNLAGVLLVLIGFIIQSKKTTTKDKVQQTRHYPLIWICAAAFLSGLTVFSTILFMVKDFHNYDFVLISWFMTGAFYLYAFKNSFPSISEIRKWINAHRTELLILGGITLLAATIRFIKLGVYPRVIDGDEGLLGLFAQSSTTGAYANPFALWENFGGIYLQFVNFWIRIFGAVPLAIRMPPALSGVLAIPALYLFARQVAGKRVAIISSFLLAVSHAAIHFSRIGSVGYIHGTWLVPLELFFLLAGLEKRKIWMTAAAGILLAIHFNIYLTAQVILAMILVFILILAVFFRNWFKSVWREVAAFLGGFTLMILPVFAYILQHPTEFFARLNSDGTFQSGWLANTMASTGQSAFKILGGRVVHAFLSLIYYPAQDFYGSAFSILSNITMILFLIGLGIALLNIRKRGMILLNGYFWAPVLAVGIFSVPPSADSYRMLIVLPPALLLAALAFDRILKIIGISWKTNKSAYVFVTTILLISLTWINLSAYFSDFVGQCRYSGDRTSRFASYLGSYTKTINFGSPIYLLSDVDFMAGTHGSTDFLNGHRVIVNVDKPLDTWEPNPGDTIIASPDRIKELEEWMKTHPGGKPDYIFDCQNLILLAYTVR